MESPGTILRQARRRHGVTQAALARRASTTQSAISRIENDRVSPRVETLGELLGLMGEELELRSEAYDFGHDRSLIGDNLDLRPADRVRRGLGFADFVRRNRGAVHAGVSSDD